MIKIDLQEPDDNSWKVWRRKCLSEQNKLICSYASNKTIAIVESLYRRQKAYYSNIDGPFSGKCAYCESMIVGKQPVDLDHFRPKKAVTDSSIHVKVKDDNDQEVLHPGYYWLAYAWENLLPSCKDCNSPNRVKGILVGKGNEFPVRKFRASKPGEETQEEPLLLNPTSRTINIKDHLLFEADAPEDFVGIIKPLTKEGEVTINLLGLNIREGLIKERKEAFKQGYYAVRNYILALVHENKTDEEQHIITIKEFIQGSRAHSAAGRAGMKAMATKLRSKNISLGSLQSLL